MNGNLSRAKSLQNVQPMGSLKTEYWFEHLKQQIKLRIWEI